MDVIKLLEYLQEILETSSKFPMTNKVMVDKDEVMEVIDQIINYLPEEFKKAQLICEEKNRILKDAKVQAEMIKKEGMDVIRQKIRNHDYVKEAKVRAEEIVSSAEKNAKILRDGSRDYATEVLVNIDKEINSKQKIMMDKVKKEFSEFIVSIEGEIDDTTKILKQNINQLKNMK
jgi:F0F1-type ATP synthase membrane subunit b/b'